MVRADTMPAVRTDKMIVKEEKERDKKEKATRQSFSCAECRRCVVVPARPLGLRRFHRGLRGCAGLTSSDRADL